MFNNQTMRSMKVLFFLVVLGVFVLANAGITLSRDSGEKEVQRVLPNMEVTIEKKNPQNVMTNREIFKVTASTAFLDENGISLDLARLPVPCKATISYLKTLGDPEARKIQILKVLPGATTFFPPPVPE